MAAFVAAGCATVKAPEGGARDRVGPQLVAVDPPAGGLLFRARKVVFTFDEHLRVNLTARDLFLSPRPEGVFEAYPLGKKLVVRLPERLAPNRTYVLTLTQAVKDFHEGNSLARSIAYPFSTGEVLDSLSFRGQVLDITSGAPKFGYLVGLYEADSVAGEAYAKRRPTYLAQTDSQGVFVFGFLAPGRYRVLGFADADQSFAWSGPSEPVALDDLDDLILSPEAAPEIRALVVTTLDTLRPLLTGVRELNATTLRLDFSEPLRTLRIGYRDSTWAYHADSLYAPFYRDTTSAIVLGLPTPPPADSFAVRLQATDTLGNALDSLLWLRRPDTTLTDYLGLYLGPEQPNPHDQRFYLTDYLDPDSLQAHLVLRDTAGAAIPYTFRLTEHRLTVTLPPGLDPKQPYELAFDSLLVSRSGYRLERPKVYALQAPRPEQYGTLSGAVETEAPNLVVELLRSGAVVRRSRGPAFRYTFLPPGTYYLRVFEDQDADGRYTPGRLFPKRLSEPIYRYPAPIVVRANWDTEGHTVTYPPN